MRLAGHEGWWELGSGLLPPLEVFQPGKDNIEIDPRALLTQEAIPCRIMQKEMPVFCGLYAQVECIRFQAWYCVV